MKMCIDQRADSQFLLQVSCSQLFVPMWSLCVSQQGEGTVKYLESDFSMW
jgi:hypothetical protein